MTWNSANNAILFNACQKLSGVTVRLSVSEDLVTYQDQGFSLQLNAYPPPACRIKASRFPSSRWGAWL